MRALFRDEGAGIWGSTTDITLYEVGLPQNANRRDVFFVFRPSGGNIAAKAYKTRADAILESGYIASATITPSASLQSVTMTDNAGNDPTMTGLIIKGIFAAAVVDCWAYTCAPDIIVCDNIAVLLQAQNAAGMALYGIVDANISVGPPGDNFPTPRIDIVSQPMELLGATDVGSLWHVQYPIDITIAIAAIDAQQSAWRTCRQYQANVQSIVWDEQRRSKNECLSLTRRDSTPPNTDDGILWKAVVSLNAEFHAMWRDDQYPR